MYTAIIAELKNVRKFSGADRLLLATCLGSQVIIGLGAKENDMVVFYPDDGQLSEENAIANDLIAYTDEQGNRKGGYFSSSRRVRCQKMRGEKSEAYVASLESLSFTGYNISKLSVGDKFNELNGIPICNKYMTPATIKAAKANQSKTQAGMNKDNLKKKFPEHVDTDQLKHIDERLLHGLVTLTGKLHGTSQRSAYIQVPEELPLTWLQKLKFAFCDAFFGYDEHLLNFWLNNAQKENLTTRPTELQWQKLYGTRRVVKGIPKEDDIDYRIRVHNIIAPYIQKGEAWYYEIVGYEDSGASIMQSVSTKEMPKDFRKRFGDTMSYKYGCLPGTCDFYIYRIMQMNEDGIRYELPWDVVKKRCLDAGIKHVPEITQFVLYKDENGIISLTDSGLSLKELIEYFVEEVDCAEPIDPSHIKEGVVIRLDRDGITKFIKQKSFNFRVLEGITKADDSFIDTEEVESC